MISCISNELGTCQLHELGQYHEMYLIPLLEQLKVGAIFKTIIPPKPSAFQNISSKLIMVVKPYFMEEKNVLFGN